jgi:hypothetical protein
MSTVTMQELELETAELLPARETLWSSSCGCRSSNNFQSNNGNGDGNTYQVAEGGGILSPAVNVSALNGNGDGNTIF